MEVSGIQCNTEKAVTSDLYYRDTTVRLKLEQYQLLTRLGTFLLPMESLKYLIHRHFFEEGDAENLQDFAETSVDFQFLFARNLMELNLLH